MSPRQANAEINRIAAEWAERVENAPLDDARQADLDAWLASDARCLGAYARARAALHYVRRARALGTDFNPDAYLAAHVPDRAEVERSEAAWPADDAGGAWLTRRRLLAGSLAGLVALTVTSFGFGGKANATVYATAIGEIRSVTLADGSRMTLNTASSARVSFSDGERRVQLQAGEALFDVASDPARPFLVAASATEVRAVGTSFVVRALATSSVSVLVNEGAVQVRRPSEPRFAGKRVSANGMAVSVPGSEITLSSVAAGQLMRELSWREGMLSFEDQTLEQAAQEFARYSERKIRFADDEIARKTVTGRYSAGDPLGFANTVAVALDLRAENTADGVLLLHK